MAATLEKSCTLLIHYDKEPAQVNELRNQLENGTTEQKIESLKKIILCNLNGEPLPQLLMTVIRFAVPSRDHTIKKLLILYWETTEKTNPDGKLKQEMILVCNALRNDLLSANEYVRGSTLRFVCKLKEAEVIEPLVPAIRQNLEHKVTYVRRNAVLAINSVFKSFDYLIPDAPELIHAFLEKEADATCKRNAFLALYSCAQDKAVEYLNSVLDQVSSWGDMLQIVVVDVIRKVCRTNPAERSKYIKCLFGLLGSSSPSVLYDAAGTLVSLSSAPTAVKAAAGAYINLLVNESDNNVKLIVLDRLVEINRKYQRMLADLVMDILRALASPSLDIRRKTLDIVLELISPKNIEEVMLVLRKEVAKTQAKEYEKAGEYRQMLVQAIHQCAVRFPEVASSVVHLLIDFLGDSNVASAVDVIVFVREVMETYPNLRTSVLRKLLDSLYQIKVSEVYRGALWIIGEYSHADEEIEAAFVALREALGPLPLINPADLAEKEATPAAKPAAPIVSTKTTVLADGTYATQSALMTNTVVTPIGDARNLRGLILAGDCFLGSVLGSTLTKLALHADLSASISQPLKNAYIAETMRAMVNVLQIARSGGNNDADSVERINQCFQVLLTKDKLVRNVWLRECRQAFGRLLAEQLAAKQSDDKKQQQAKEPQVQADDLIKIRQLRGKRALAQDMDDEDDEGTELSKIIGAEKEGDGLSKLNRVYQLTGYSDPIYAEAVVTVYQYDIVLDVTVINQTNDTLQNVQLELATLGDLKLVDRPQSHTIAPRDQIAIKASVKVSSTETGVIFGNIVYDVAGSATSDKNCVILNEIHIDIMDYIFPASCTEVQFRAMWAEFEWENKVTVNTTLTDLSEYLQHIMKSTNMKSLSPGSAFSGDCNFLSANLYAKSVFGEDALANVCVEKQVDGKIVGYIRIRSKTQGIALSIGDKITHKQRAAA